MPQWEYNIIYNASSYDLNAAAEEGWEVHTWTLSQDGEATALLKRPRQEASAAEPPLAALRRFATVKEKEALSLAGNEKAEKDANYHYGRHDAFARMLYEIDILEGTQP